METIFSKKNARIIFLAASILLLSNGREVLATQDPPTVETKQSPILVSNFSAEDQNAASKNEAGGIGNKDIDYKRTLRKYRDEIKAYSKSPDLIEPKSVENRNGLATRKMPPLPTKLVQFSDSLFGKSENNDSIFRRNALSLQRPKLSGLINVQTNLNPLTLDAETVQSATLRQLLMLAAENNLDITISRDRAKAQKFRYIAALGGFLPDLNLSDQQLWLNGKIGVPLNNNSNIFGTSSGSGSNSRIINLTGPITIGTAGFNYHLYQGGKIIFGAIQNKHQFNAASATFHASYSDTLLEVAKRYYQLVLAETLLQIRIRAVNTSEEQVRVNTKRFEEGFGTNLDVLQARTQLSLDRQSLLDQQVSRREASINLTALINYNLVSDIEPADEIRQIELISTNLAVTHYLQTALSNRAELKEFAELRKSAKSEIAIAGAKLQPTVNLTGNVYGIGRTPSSSQALFVLGLNVNWQLGGLGTIDAANIAAAKVEARIANSITQQEIVKILQEVRTSYLHSAAAEKNIIETDTQVASAFEELRLARLRYQNGVGTNLDVLTGQRDFTQAQINKATAIVNQNIAQSQLVRDLGLATVENLASKQSIKF